MNGVHDLGGMQNFGPVEHEENEPVFHEPWEARVFALRQALKAWGKWNIDTFRYQRSLIPAADYLSMSYYEQFLVTMEELLAKTGLVTSAEIASGKPAAGSPKATPPLTAEQVPAIVARGNTARRDVAVMPRFRVWQAMRARQWHS